MPTLRTSNRLQRIGMDALGRYDLRIRRAQFAMERKVVRALLLGLGVEKWQRHKWAQKTRGDDDCMRMTFRWLHEAIGDWPVQMVSFGLSTENLPFCQWSGDLSEVFHPRSRTNQLRDMWRHAQGDNVRREAEFKYLACVFGTPSNSAWEGKPLVMHNVILSHPDIKTPDTVRYLQWCWGFILEDIQGFAAWLPLFFELQKDNIYWTPEGEAAAMNAPRWKYNVHRQEQR